MIVDVHHNDAMPTFFDVIQKTALTFSIFTDFVLPSQHKQSDSLRLLLTADSSRNAFKTFFS